MRLRLQPLAILTLLAAPFPVVAQADGDPFFYCEQRAQKFSGYTGPVPDRYTGRGSLDGAARGAIEGAIISSALGAGKRQQREAARRGAIIGSVVGSARTGSRYGREDYRIRAYRLEYEACLKAKGY